MIEFRIEVSDAEIEKFIQNNLGEEDLKRVMGKCCALVERSAKELVPKKTGALARSITSEVNVDDNKVEGIIYTPLEYAPYVEYGTGKWAENGNGRQTPWAYYDEKTGELIWTAGQHPQPYMRPALEENREEILRLIKEELF